MNKKNGLDPATLPAISYCIRHEYYINLHPELAYSKVQGYRVICPDCGAYGAWKKTPQKAIISWNEKHGICLISDDNVGEK